MNTFQKDMLIMSRKREISEFLNKDVSILTKINKGVKRRYTLEELRKDIENQKEVDEQDFGGCGCMLEDNEETDSICK